MSLWHVCDYYRIDGITFLLVLFFFFQGHNSLRRSESKITTDHSPPLINNAYYSLPRDIRTGLFNQICQSSLKWLIWFERSVLIISIAYVTCMRSSSSAATYYLQHPCMHWGMYLIALIASVIYQHNSKVECDCDH